MSIGDIVYYAFWWTVAGAIILVVLVPIFSFLLTAAVAVLLMQVGLVLAIVGYIAGIPWAVYRRAVDGRWPDGG